ncbi:MAG: hypothetical protein ACRDSZ_01100 [Pseudonocardiaceae bacterium]
MFATYVGQGLLVALALAVTSLPAALKTSKPSMRRRLRPLLTLVRPQRGLLAFAVLSGMVHHLVMMAVAGTSAWLVGSAITGSSADDLRPGLVLLPCLLVPLAVTRWLESHLGHTAASASSSTSAETCTQRSSGWRRVT